MYKRTITLIIPESIDEDRINYLLRHTMNFTVKEFLGHDELGQTKGFTAKLHRLSFEQLENDKDTFIGYLDT